MHMGIWLGVPQPDRRPEPPIEFVRADIAERMADALEKIVDLSKPGQTIGISQATDIICDVWNESRSALSAWKDGR
jgi:hypothetical protein